MQCYRDACGIAVHVPGAADGEGEWRKRDPKSKLQWSQARVWYPLINPLIKLIISWLPWYNM